jgi:formamidopyrimidine-DNA glycosylase
MPELPEVETIKRDLAKLAVGKKVLDITTDSAKQVQPSLQAVKKAIVGATINKVERRAKLLLLFLSNKLILAIHLKLTGRLLVRKRGAPKDDWQHITLFLSDNCELRFADLRKFGWLRLIANEKSLERLLKDFGPEPLDGLGFKTFQTIISSSRRPIKQLLLDQKKIAGVGNIYANDALNLAKINPRRPSNALNPSQQNRLFKAVIRVLQAGIKYRGASDQYYLDALGHKGHYQDHFLVYGREGKKCFNCGSKIKKIKLGGRGTYFCPHCQS